MAVGTLPVSVDYCLEEAGCGSWSRSDLPPACSLLVVAWFRPETRLVNNVATSFAVACLRKMTSLRVFGAARMSKFWISSSKSAYWRGSEITTIWFVRSSAVTLVAELSPLLSGGLSKAVSC